MKTLGLYIHIPFCARKCRYCDFISFAGMEDAFGSYIDAVLAEASLYSDYFKGHIVDTLFIGGGTPSLLPPHQIEKLICGLNERFSLDLKEVTIEANPESISEEKLAAYKECGISRLSIGLQTHEDDILMRIGRGHTFDQFIKAYESANRFFDNINVDTIFGLPGQTVNNFERTIHHLIDISPSHVSAYSLKLEEGTPLAKSFSGADEDTDREMYHSAASMLTGVGYSHYETSNFAQEGYECRHNLKYWLGEEYLGLGTAAHSYTSGSQKQRSGNTENINEYIKSINEGRFPAAQPNTLTKGDEITEYIMLRLRLKQGISYGDFKERFSTDFIAMCEPAITLAKKNGLITADESGIYPTLKGFDLQNLLITEFMKII